MALGSSSPMTTIWCARVWGLLAEAEDVDLAGSAGKPQSLLKSVAEHTPELS
jgi:hypothetical protein